MSGILGLSKSSHLTQKLQDTSQNLVAAHSGVDLACGHKKGNQHGDKEPAKSSQALKERQTEAQAQSQPTTQRGREAGSLPTHLIQFPLP